jgi:hypothetical protein
MNEKKESRVFTTLMCHKKLFLAFPVGKRVEISDQLKLNLKQNTGKVLAPRELWDQYLDVLSKFYHFEKEGSLYNFPIVIFA